MFKYTIKPHIRHTLIKYRKGYHGDKPWQFIISILATVDITDYMQRSVFYEAPEVEFYSVKPVQHVPIRGYLYPVSLFIEENID